MKRLIALMMCAVSLGAAAQMPNSNSEIPVGLQEDVVCWFPLENHFEDISSNAIATSASESGLAFEAETSASFPFQNYLSFSGGVIDLGSPSELMWPNLVEGAFSVWLKPQNTNGDGRLFSSENPECCNSIEFRDEQSTASYAGVQFSLIGAYNIVQLPYNEWSHVIVNAETYGQESIQVSIHLNGSLLLSLEPQPIDTNLPVYGYDDMFIGQKASPGFDKWLGDAAHMVWFSRGLDESEINYLYSGNNSVGCTDPDACNYNVAATESDDTCDYSCCPGPGCCGEGMFWDWNIGECAITNPSDSNFDGCVQLNDLLDLLGAYGDCGAEESAWQCGDALEYQGYDYATVQIGEQCWFAENLRSEDYENGDAIPSGLSGSEWTTTSSGAGAVYGESEVCEHLSPDIDACDPLQSLDEYGRLYNWYAVEDARSLCPSGWHVPSNGEWTTLTDFLGGEGVAGGQMRTTYGWNNGGHGTNSSGFSGLPGGNRVTNGDFGSGGSGGGWWSSSLNEAEAWYRGLGSGAGNVTSYDVNLQYGLSVRCVRDAE